MTAPRHQTDNRKRIRNDKLRVTAFGLIWGLLGKDKIAPEFRFTKAICATADYVPINREAMAAYLKFKHQQKMESECIK